jgi:uncharacterized membrane protein YfcA
MEPLIEDLLVAVRRLARVRAVVWLAVVAASGFAFGWMLREGVPTEYLDASVFAWVLLVGAAALNMKDADRRAERRRKERLDRLYGRRSS